MQAESSFIESDELRVIGELALELHTSESTQLSVELPSEHHRSYWANETHDYQIEENAVRFPTLEARNRIVAAHVFSEKRALPKPERNWISVAVS